MSELQGAVHERHRAGPTCLGGDRLDLPGHSRGVFAQAAHEHGFGAECHDRHPFVGLQPSERLDGRPLDLVEDRLHRAADIEQKNDGQPQFVAAECRDRDRFAVFPDDEVPRLKDGQTIVRGATAVITDVLHGPRVPKGPRLYVFPLLAQCSVAELREFVEYVRANDG